MTEGQDQVYPTPYGEVCAGLTKREYFAAVAMQGLCLKVAADYTTGSCNAALAERAVVLADALINELNKENQQ